MQTPCIGGSFIPAARATTAHNNREECVSTGPCKDEKGQPYCDIDLPFPSTPRVLQSSSCLSPPEC